MTALDALVTVLDAGGKFVPDPESPKVLFPTGLRALALLDAQAVPVAKKAVG